MESEALVLVILFNVKHVLGDFVLQSSNMAIGKGKENWEFVSPLSFHCLVHVILSAIVIVLFMDVKYLWFLPTEFVVHFFIDRLKSGPKYGGRFSMTKEPRFFWLLFGLDQFLHQCTYILFIFLALL